MHSSETDLLKLLGRSPVAFGIAFEAIILDRIANGQMRDACQLVHPAAGSITLPQSPDGTPSPFSRLKDTLTLNESLPVLNAARSYFVKVDANFPGIDAAIVTPQQVILVQITVASRHDVKFQGIRRVYDMVVGELGSDGGRIWSLVFVVTARQYGERLARSTPSETAVARAKHVLGIDLQLGFLSVPTSRDPVRAAPRLDPLGFQCHARLQQPLVPVLDWENPLALVDFDPGEAAPPAKRIREE
jgi:hypothetical protein